MFVSLKHKVLSLILEEGSVFQWIESSQYRFRIGFYSLTAHFALFSGPIEYLAIEYNGRQKISNIHFVGTCIQN